MSEADQHLLQLIRAGDHDGWSQFVARFQRRLIAFATRQVGQVATAEDLVQETFIAFLKGMADYRSECDLESFLFQILRRRTVDHYRRQGRNKEIPACTFNGLGAADSAPDPLQQAVAQDMHASWYARRSEARDSDEQILAAAVREFASRLHVGEKFRDLKIAEGLFYAGRRNRELAQVLGTSENEISQVKLRLVKRLSQLVKAAGGSTKGEDPESEAFGHLLTSVWESQRPSCPKRTTLGKSVLGILPPEWEDFVEFHVNTLGCTFCIANLVELSSTGETKSANERLFTSTVGFLKT